MKRIRTRSLAVLLGLAFLTTAKAQNITQLFGFPCPNQQFGTCPQGYRPDVLIQASDGNFYGTAQLTTQGTSNPQGGTVFKITPAGQFTLLFTFTHNLSGNYVNGDQPATALVEGNDGFLYGSTFTGGTNNAGVLFRIGKNGKGFKVVHNFCSSDNCADGNLPIALLLGQDGNFYGATEFGGSNDANCQIHGGCGTIFRFTPPSTLTTLFVFDGSQNVGASPIGLTQGADGNFYGVGGGQIFRFTSAGQFTVLQDFPKVNGILPTNATSGLFQASNGILYGALTTYAIDQLQFYEINPSGSGFLEFPSFGDRSGLGPSVPRLIQASDGNLWDAVDVIGNGGGSVIAMSPASGAVLRSFAFTGATGETPEASVVQAADGKLFGTTILGGKVAKGKVASGTVWTLDAGLAAPPAAIANFAPSSGGAGSTVTIRGNHFIGTTAVTFNGVSAAFKVLTVNFITATVPAGASSGPIAVTNPGGTTDSSGQFTAQ
ncbi:MAG: IPT/TIG domain-containing protein [Acidobacteriia bacterium]|nr:IPT/TIG domain-containing protein [Terriglobia bacterium]